MLNEAETHTFAEQWISAWNAHDADAILSHYAENVDYHSPVAHRLVGRSHLKGKAAVSQYIRDALAELPHLKFTLHAAYSGAGSVVLVYESINNTMAAETFIFNADRKICQVRCHYRPISPEDSAHQKIGLSLIRQ